MTYAQYIRLRRTLFGDEVLRDHHEVVGPRLDRLYEPHTAEATFLRGIAQNLEIEMADMDEPAERLRLRASS